MYLALADQAMVAMRKRDLTTLAVVIGQVDRLEKSEQEQFRSAMALRQGG